MDNDKMIIVTGAAGFIGSCVMRHLGQLGITNIVAVDVLGKGERWNNLVGKSFVDYLHRDELMPFLEGRGRDIHAIIHLGACSDTQEMDADFLMSNNYRYTQRLAEFALENEIRFIYASSAATYGDGSHGFSDRHEFLDDLVPLNMYGYSKHLFDLWAKRQGVLDRIVGLKYFNVFGPGEYDKGNMASMVMKMFPKVVAGEEIQLFKSNEPKKFKDGEQVRDFIYVKDAVQMTCGFLENTLGGIYNIGTGEPTTWVLLATYLFEALGKKPKIGFIDMPELLSKKYQNYTCADMTKYCEDHGFADYKPPLKYGVKKGVFDYVQNYLVSASRW